MRLNLFRKKQNKYDQYGAKARILINQFIPDLKDGAIEKHWQPKNKKNVLVQKLN